MNPLIYVHIVAVLAVLQYFFFGILVGRARDRYGIQAPATTGHEQFERMFRVQMNTLEQIVGFLPSIYIAAQFWPGAYMGALGLVYLLGRFIYWRSYVTNPRSRGLGFILTVLPTFAFLVAALVGAVSKLSAA